MDGRGNEVDWRVRRIGCFTPVFVSLIEKNDLTSSAVGEQPRPTG